MRKNYCTYFDVHGSRILHRWVDSDGNQHIETISNIPLVMYLPAKTGSYKSIFGDSLKAVNFDSIYDAKEWRKKYDDVEGVEIYGNDDWGQQFVADRYPTMEPPPKKLLKIIAIDGEMEHDNGFPEPQFAANEVMSISIQVFGGKSYTLGFKPLEKEVPETEYIKCNDEADMLERFIRLFRVINPEICTGWNTASFDLPYLVRRIDMILGDGNADRLSPFHGMAKNLIRFSVNRDTLQEEARIVGVNCIDYLTLYKKFNLEKLESYRLDFVGEHEGVGRKIDYSEFNNSLMKLYRGNFPKFILYNAVDNKIVEQLDDKLGFLELAMSIAGITHSRLRDTTGTVKVWDNLIYHMALAKDLQIPPKKHHQKFDYVGGYVKEPIPGLYRWPVTFDLTSLYPSIVQLLNMSSETMVRPRQGNTEQMIRDTLDGKINPKEIIGDNEYCYAINGAMFKREPKGIVTEAMEYVFFARKDAKDKMKEKKRELESLKLELEKLKNGT